jgi:thiol:disulfide interchange protein
MRPRPAVLLFLVLECALSFAQGNKAPNAQLSGVADSTYLPVLKFDSKRDAAADIQAAIVEAQKTGSRIILDVGGDWCTWCHVLDKFFEQHPDTARLRDKNFITVAVFYSKENKNEKALSPYPKLEGIPHFFVLDKNGVLLHSQGIVELETDGELDAERIKNFLLKWAPKE